MNSRVNVDYAGLEVYHFEHFERNPCDSTPRLLLEVTCEVIFQKKYLPLPQECGFRLASRVAILKMCPLDLNLK